MQKVSVIIPTYNREKTIERAIRSVLNQTYTNLEVIVVDDGSTDATEDVVAAIRDERIHYVKKENGGAASARNEGVKYASAELIAFQDSDDVWHEDKLEKQMRYWQEHPECGLIYCAYHLYGIEGDVIKVPLESSRGELAGDILSTLLLNNTIGTPTMLLKKSCFGEAGGFDTALPCLEDWEFAIRIAKRYLIGYVDEVLLDAYRVDGGISANYAGHYEIRCKIIAKYKAEMIEAGIFNDVVGSLFVTAEKQGILEQVKRLLMMYLQS